MKDNAFGGMYPHFWTTLENLMLVSTITCNHQPIEVAALYTQREQGKTDTKHRAVDANPAKNRLLTPRTP